MIGKAQQERSEAKVEETPSDQHTPTSINSFHHRYLFTMVVVYTCGACVNNGQDNAQAGWGIHFPDFPGYDEYGPLPGDHQASSRAELWAIKRALEIIDHKLNCNGDHTVRTDSEYCVNIFTKWIDTWRDNNWVKSNGDPVQNADILKSIDHVWRNLQGDVDFEWVRGHATSKGNRIADDYAGRGAQGEWMK
ncbi:unnamed protein product [Sympodiomycopsis kandeliae]